MSREILGRYRRKRDGLEVFLISADNDQAKIRRMQGAFYETRKMGLKSFLDRHEKVEETS